MKNVIAVLFTLFVTMILTSCGPKVFQKGDYDEDVEKTNLLNDKWSETDMQKVVKDLVGSLSNHPSVAGAKEAPLCRAIPLWLPVEERLKWDRLLP